MQGGQGEGLQPEDLGQGEQEVQEGLQRVWGALEQEA